MQTPKMLKTDSKIDSKHAASHYSRRGPRSQRFAALPFGGCPHIPSQEKLA